MAARESFVRRDAPAKDLCEVAVFNALDKRTGTVPKLDEGWVGLFGMWAHIVIERVYR
jgi:hypothetical protein